MKKLVLGVINNPYGHSHGADRRANANTTTGEVAQILENKYHIMQHFYDLHEREINSSILQSVTHILNEALMGSPVNTAGLDDIDNLKPIFEKMILTKELDGVADGVPTQASLSVVNHRKKKGESRPSFLDTRLYMQSFKAWIK